MNKPLSKTYRRPSPYKLPSVPEMEKLAEDLKYSPDMYKLEQYQHQLFFACDELMPLHRNHALVEDATDTWTAFTMDNFSMFKKKLGEESWPLVLDKRFTGVPYTHIKGELYALRPGRFKELDKYYKNGLNLQRRRVQLLIPHLYKEDNKPWQYRCFPIIRAWMYVGITEHWMNILDSGYLFSPVKVFWPNNLNFLTYYYFTLQELKS